MSYPLDSTHPSHFSKQREFENEKKKTEEEQQKKMQRLLETNKAQTAKKKHCYSTGLEIKQKEQDDKSLRLGQKEQKSSQQQISKLRTVNSTGQFIQAPGSRIVRAVGTKDRHSKVCTSKGPRDRRVRLSPTTAIQLYDVQDRLGYDRPSKALDWLIDKAKTSIEALPHDLPIQTHHYVNIKSSVLQTERDLKEHIKGCDSEGKTTTGLSCKYSLGQDHQTLISNMIPFTTGTCASASSSSHFKDYSTQDLHSASGDMDFYQSLLACNSCIAGNGRQGLLINSLSESFQKQFVDQSQFSSQREPLQSSNLFPLHGWVNPAISRPPFSCDDHNLYSQLPTSHSISSPTFSSDGVIGRNVSATIQGEEQKHSAVPNKGSSACSPTQIYYS